MAHDALVCRSCGNLISECSDPERDWHPHLSTCYATASRQWGRRVLDKKFEKRKPDTDGLHPLDGASVYVTPFAPEGDDPFVL